MNSTETNACYVPNTPSRLSYLSLYLSLSLSLSVSLSLSLSLSVCLSLSLSVFLSLSLSLCLSVYLCLSLSPENSDWNLSYFAEFACCEVLDRNSFFVLFLRCILVGRNYLHSYLTC